MFRKSTKRESCKIRYFTFPWKSVSLQFPTNVEGWGRREEEDYRLLVAHGVKSLRNEIFDQRVRELRTPPVSQHVE